MPNEPVIDPRKQMKQPEPRPEKVIGSEDAAAPSGSPKRTEKFEVEAVTQEQEGGDTASVPEQ